MRHFSFVCAVIAVWLVNQSLAMKKFEKGALTYLLLRSLQPKPQSEMMVMTPAGVDINELKVPMMMMVMPVGEMKAMQMMPVAPQPAAEQAKQMMMMMQQPQQQQQQMMMMNQMMESMMMANAMKEVAAGKGTMDTMSPMMMMPPADSGDKMVEALKKIEAQHRARKHAHAPMVAAPHVHDAHIHS